MARMQQLQEPMAVLGFACRLPGSNNSPTKLWEFLERGGIASNKVPRERFHVEAHYDGSNRPGTMRPPGGMFLDIDPADFDASFFEVGRSEAIAMDPNQRQMLEVVYEGLENSGIPMAMISGAPVGCFVGSFASDYGDIQNRDTEDRPINCVIGIGRSIMANRLSYFLNAKGPSITIDTACSGSLVCLDLACRSLQSGEIDIALVAASNLYMNPDHAMDHGTVGHAYSPTGLCHTFDASADGYVKAEAVSCVVIKRLSDAIADRDPIRGVIRGTASNSNGRTAGIASPSSEAQAAAIRSAYANAGLGNFNETSYLECHGTGTQAGDPTEVNGAGYVFAATRDSHRPLIIGSIKSNIGHTEPVAGSLGLIKVMLAMENGVIPGTPSFVNPNPNIDFVGNKVKAFRGAIKWPDIDYPLRRASINSFGFGGSNAHAIVDQPSVAARKRYTLSYKTTDGSLEDDLDFLDEEDTSRPYLCVLSASDATSLMANIRALCAHLINPRVKIDLADIAHTLSERRTQHWHRAFVTTRTTVLEEKEFLVGHKQNAPLTKIAMVFTGQGAQWPQMGRALFEVFPWTISILEELDDVLQQVKPDPPEWSIMTELTETRSPEHMRQPELSQTLVTALQLCLVAILHSWGIEPNTVVGHSSGEIVAAYSAGLITRASAIVAAFYRGRAARNWKPHDKLGMLAIGVDAQTASALVEKHRGSAWIACYNSPNSVTVSGRKSALEEICSDVKSQGRFARILHVDLPYHSHMMAEIGDEYHRLLSVDENFLTLHDTSSNVTMFSSTLASRMEPPANRDYWQANMINPVRFDQAFTRMMLEESPNLIIEVGPSGALAGPISQLLQALPTTSKDVVYCSSWARDPDNAAKPLFDVAGRIFLNGTPIDLARVNSYDADTIRTVVDLPNYSWNHSVKYWHESDASKDWRFKQFLTHELLGSKIPGTLWSAPSWRNVLTLADLPWLRDHHIGPNILLPGAGYLTMALEAMYQTHRALHPDEELHAPNELAYKFRNVKFERAMVLEEDKTTAIKSTLSKFPGSQHWYEFKILTEAAGVVYRHCSGMIRVQPSISDDENLPTPDLRELRHPQSSRLWYKVQRDIGLDFGPAFQKLRQIESTNGSHSSRATLSLEPPASKWMPSSYYPLHPAVMDACFQTATPANCGGERGAVNNIMLPASIDDLVVSKVPRELDQGLSIAKSKYSGRGRKEVAKSWAAHVDIYDPRDGKLMMRLKGLSYVGLDAEEKAEQHVFLGSTWKPDITLLSSSQLADLLAFDNIDSRIATVIDLIAYRTPTLKVLEVNLSTDISSTWFHRDSDNSIRVAYSQYDLASTSAQAVMAAQEAYGAKRNATFHHMSSTKSAVGIFASNGPYDLVIVKASKSVDTQNMDAIRDLETLVGPNSFLLYIHDITSFNHPTPLDNRAHWHPDLTSGHPTVLNAQAEEEILNKQASRDFTQTIVTPDTFRVISIGLNDQPVNLFRKSSGLTPTANTNSLEIFQFETSLSSRASSLTARLQKSGYDVSTVLAEHPIVDAIRKPSSLVLVLDEMYTDLLRQASRRQWESLRQLLSSGKSILWVTTGAATCSVKNPNRALAQGLFRTVRMELPDAKLVVLDVESPDTEACYQAIARVLGKLRDYIDSAETEYAERDGILLVQRIVPDQGINIINAAIGGKAQEPIVKSLQCADIQIRLQALKVGTLESLAWCETDLLFTSGMDMGMVEIEVRAIGVNFKDVATTMGIVPENEHMIGCECSGYVKQIVPGETRFHVGDRVAVVSSGTYANRIRCPVDRVHIIPPWMSFEEAATIPLVYLTGIYSLYHLANLKEGQTVLIHSAAGGVGLAAIQLAQYKKAEVFATVSTGEKREFLENTFGIPSENISNSRNATFSRDIRRATGGRGVDVILNSLTGDLLDESWRLLADGGVMVEIGKRDIVERNFLAMDPFDRNCSFRAVDLSYVREITDSLIGRLLEEIFDLVDGGHIKPIQPIHTFGFDEVISALTFMRRGQHLGKIIISKGETGDDLQVPVKPAVPRLKLDSNASYLIVGGLKGLCGSLAVHMAHYGARHIIVMSRSGLDNEASAKVIQDCAAHQCEVLDAKGDVGDERFVRHVFGSQPRRIAGVIQGAMVLKDKPFEMMTQEEFQVVLHAKVAGTWNIHNAAQELLPPLNFFTLLSSISGVVGNKGQANYAAANTFLDAFAYFRQAFGLCAHAVDLGTVEDVGYIAEQGNVLQAHFDRRQLRPINEDMLRRIVTLSIFQQQQVYRRAAGDKGHQLITGLAHPLPVEASGLTKEHRFAYLFNSHVGDNENAHVGDSGGSAIDNAINGFHKTLESGSDHETLVQATLNLLLSQITVLLRLEAKMEPGKSLSSYGLDSLSAVELRSWIRQKLGAELSTLDIINASSLVALSEKLVLKISRQDNPKNKGT